MRNIFAFMAMAVLLVFSQPAHSQAQLSRKGLDKTDKWIQATFAKGTVPPFSFTLDGVPSEKFIKSWDYKKSKITVQGANAVGYSIIYKDKKSGLSVTATVTGYTDFEAVEWVLRFANTGKGSSGQIANVRSADFSLKDKGATAYGLRRLRGPHGGRGEEDRRSGGLRGEFHDAEDERGIRGWGGRGEGHEGRPQGMPQSGERLRDRAMTKKQKKTLIRIIVAAAATAALALADRFVSIVGVPFGSALMGWPNLLLHLAVYALIGGDILRKAFLGARNGRLFDENFLMAVATVGAFALAAIDGSGDYTEGIAVMLFYQIGEFFQKMAVGKSRRNIAELMDIKPDSANVERDGRLVQVPPEEVAVGTVITVRPGERIPIDGTVVEGESALDTSALTGESLPRGVGPGDSVYSGSVNASGTLRIRTEKPFGESTVSKILELVENSTSKKSRSEAFISRFARVYPRWRRPCSEPAACPLGRTGHTGR